MMAKEAKSISSYSIFGSVNFGKISKYSNKRRQFNIQIYSNIIFEKKKNKLKQKMVGNLDKVNWLLL